MSSPDFLLNPQKASSKFEPIRDESLSELKLETNSGKSLEQIAFISANESRTTESESPLENESSQEIQENLYQLNVIMQENSKKFFLRLVGYEPKFFHMTDETKKIKEVIEDYLKTINVNVNDIIKESFLYRGKRINLDETIKNIEHLSWITSNDIN